MNLAVDPIEAFWLVVNLVTLAFTIAGLLDAIDNKRAVKLMNGYARELASSGNVRRSWLLSIIAGLLVVVVIPGLFVDRPVPPSPPVIALLLMPVALLVLVVTDARDRRRMTAITAAEIVIERESSIERLERLVLENTAISQDAAQSAKEAFHEANSVNEKIAAQGAALVSQGEELAADRDRTAAVVQTIDTTAEQVADLHEGTAPEQKT